VQKVEVLDFHLIKVGQYFKKPIIKFETENNENHLFLKISYIQKFFSRKATCGKSLRYDLMQISAILCNFYFLTNLIRGRDDAK